MDIVNWPTEHWPTMAMDSKMALARMVKAIYVIDKRLLNKYNLSTEIKSHKYLIYILKIKKKFKKIQKKVVEAIEQSKRSFSSKFRENHTNYMKEK